MGGSEGDKLNAPELQMHDPLHAILWYIIVIEERVSYARDAEEQNAGRREEKGAEVGSLGGLGDSGVEGEEGCFLDHFKSLLFLYMSGRREYLRWLWRGAREALLALNRPSTVTYDGDRFHWCRRGAFGARVFFSIAASVR